MVQTSGNTFLILCPEQISQHVSNELPVKGMVYKTKAHQQGGSKRMMDGPFRSKKSQEHTTSASRAKPSPISPTGWQNPQGDQNGQENKEKDDPGEETHNSIGTCMDRGRELSLARMGLPMDVAISP